MILICIVTGVAWGVIGYVAGKYDERFAWNDLIRKGILPKPKGVKR